MLHARERVAGFVQVRQHGHALDAQAIENDVYMDVAAFIVTVRVRTNQSLVAGEMLLQNSSPNSCARSIVNPFSSASRGSKLIM